MRKDIALPKVENIGIAIIKELNDEKTADVFNVYLLNFGDKVLENVLVSSKGYGLNETSGEAVKTSVLRHALGTVQPKSFAKIEPIIEAVFALTNEYWLSYYIKKDIFDKKFIFLPESVRHSNFIDIPLIDKKGVLIT
ncbi:MAG: hypothetical protein R3279_02045 [Putridiphycobacter sp.]|jgi:hypothetical protein|nr:hypothetical protein [Putridiphycobacter sp.]